MRLAARVDVRIDAVTEFDDAFTQKVSDNIGASMDTLKSGVESELKAMYPDANINATVIRLEVVR